MARSSIASCRKRLMSGAGLERTRTHVASDCGRRHDDSPRHQCQPEEAGAEPAGRGPTGQGLGKGRSRPKQIVDYVHGALVQSWRDARQEPSRRRYPSRLDQAATTAGRLSPVAWSCALATHTHFSRAVIYPAPRLRSCAGTPLSRYPVIQLSRYPVTPLTNHRPQHSSQKPVGVSSNPPHHHNQVVLPVDVDQVLAVAAEADDGLGR